MIQLLAVTLMFVGYALPGLGVIGAYLLTDTGALSSLSLLIMSIKKSGAL